MTKLEEIAIALWDRESVRATGRHRNVEWKDAGDGTQAMWIDTARAAVEAMREPSIDMQCYGVEAGAKAGKVIAERIAERLGKEHTGYLTAVVVTGNGSIYKAAYIAMIDAILAEGVVSQFEIFGA